jgi:hypothetical protein
MIIAVFARRLRPGVSVEQFVAAWAPDGGEPYPAGAEVALDPADDRRILTGVPGGDPAADPPRVAGAARRGRRVDRVGGRVRDRGRRPVTAGGLRDTELARLERSGWCRIDPLSEAPAGIDPVTFLRVLPGVLG